MNHSKTNILKNTWIIIRSAYVTLWLSLRALRIGRFGTRAQMDELLRLWSSKLLDLVKLSCRVENPHNFRPIVNQPYIIMSNHASLYDIPLIFTGLPGSIRMIAKKELSRVPIWGHAMKNADFIFIDRKNSAQAIQDLAIAKEKMHHGIILWLAPEGTRSKNGKLNLFKKGGFMLALEMGALIVPVGIRGADRILPPKTLQFSLNQSVEVHIGEPIDAKDYTVKTRNELIRKVRNAIADAAQLELA